MVQASAQWYVRYDATDNNSANGFDPEIPNAGTNYANDTQPILKVTDAASPSVGSTTLTSATGGFTADMIGNALAIFSGTNRNNDPWYWIVGFTDANTITVDHSLDNGAGALSNGSISIGGARNYVFTGTRRGGNTIWVRGDGSDDPSTVLYNVGSYLNMLNGNSTTGLIHLRGYNGRPSFQSTSSLVFHSCNFVVIDNVKLIAGGTGWYNSHALIYGSSPALIRNSILDQNGYENTGARGVNVENCWFRNSGASSDGLYPAYYGTSSMYGQYIRNSFIQGWNGPGLALDEIGGDCHMNIIKNCRSHGVRFNYNNVNRNATLTNNVIDSNSGVGIYYQNRDEVHARRVKGNIITNNAQGGIQASQLTEDDNNYIGVYASNNYYYNNGGSGNYINITAGNDDVVLSSDPFFDSSNNDYRLNNEYLKQALVDEYVGISGLKTYRAVGAIQHPDPIPSKHPLSRF